MFNLDNLLQSGKIPDFIIRLGIRYLLAKKLKEESVGGTLSIQKRKLDFVTELKQSPIAIETDEANKQHYEVPSEFYELVLGPNRKYSSAFWDESTKTLDEAEEKMLALSVERAGIRDGHSVLDLGCGWGSMSLWLAQKFPNSAITGLSNSKSQRASILERAAKFNINNLEIITANINDYCFDNRQFDRIVSIEMLEHMKNYRQLFKKLAACLVPEGRFFVHVFTHKEFAYHYLDEGEHDWLTRYFFSGGTMPSNDLFSYFDEDLCIEEQWLVSGTHYQKTAEAWLKNTDANKEAILRLFKACYGAGNENLWFHRWRIFFMSCAELWGYKNGSEWMVSHYLFKKTAKR